jgi:hypothetical protein
MRTWLFPVRLRKRDGFARLHPRRLRQRPAGRLPDPGLAHRRLSRRSDRHDGAPRVQYRPALVPGSDDLRGVPAPDVRIGPADDPAEPRGRPPADHPFARDDRGPARRQVPDQADVPAGLHDGVAQRRGLRADLYPGAPDHDLVTATAAGRRAHRTARQASGIATCPRPAAPAVPRRSARASGRSRAAPRPRTCAGSAASCPRAT